MGPNGPSYVLERRVPRDKPLLCFPSRAGKLGAGSWKLGAGELGAEH